MPKAKDGRPTCTAHSKQTGEPCKQYPKRGLKVCHYHGGNAPAARHKAQENIARDKAAAAWAKASADLAPVEDPLTELSKLATQVVGWKDVLAKMVDNLRSEYRYETEYNEAVRGEVILFERAMDRCIQVLGLIAKLNIDERLAAIEESTARALEEALLAAFEEAGLGITQADEKERVTRAFARHLHVVAS